MKSSLGGGVAGKRVMGSDPGRPGTLLDFHQERNVRC